MQSNLSFSAFNSRVTACAADIGVDPEFIHRLLANVITIQILESHLSQQNLFGYVKGGTGVLLRTGIATSRTTKDLDVAVRMRREAAEEEILSLQTKTFNRFTVARVIRKPDKTQKIGMLYRLLEFEIQITYGNSQWRTVVLEVGMDEFELDSSFTTTQIDHSILDVFQKLELQIPETLSLMPVEHQIAQKIHAVTQPESDRGHDLYDIWLCLEHENIDLILLNETLGQVFRHRATHSLPLGLTVTQRLRDTFIGKTQDLPTKPSFDEARLRLDTLLSEMNEN